MAGMGVGEAAAGTAAAGAAGAGTAAGMSTMELLSLLAPAAMEATTGAGAAMIPWAPAAAPMTGAALGGSSGLSALSAAAPGMAAGTGFGAGSSALPTMEMFAPEAYESLTGAGASMVPWESAPGPLQGAGLGGPSGLSAMAKPIDWLRLASALKGFGGAGAQMATRQKPPQTISNSGPSIEFPKPALKGPTPELEMILAKLLAAKQGVGTPLVRGLGGMR